MGLIIKGGRVIDPSQNLDREADVLIVDGRDRPVVRMKHTAIVVVAQRAV